MATARDLIKASLRLIGAIATGETPSADEQTDALSAMNRMIDSWSNESLIIYEKVREEFSLTVNDGEYTIGASGDFNTTRPMRIEAATYEDQSASPAFEYPINIINLDEWANIQAKDLTGIPTHLYFETSYPLATIHLWPKPDTADKLVLYSWKPLSSFASANATASLPPGYEDALVYNLAVRLAPEYGKAVAPEIASTALDAKGNIKRMNIKPHYLRCDPFLNNRRTMFDYRIGE